MWDFFIAHAGPDKSAAEVLYDLLSQSSRPFVDSRCLLLGDDWDTKLAAAQKESQITVVLVSDRTDTAYYQREEIAAAIDLARRDSEAHRVVPIYLDEKAAASDSVPYGLRLKHGIVLSGDKTIKHAASDLLSLLEQLNSSDTKEQLHSNSQSDDGQTRAATPPTHKPLKYYVYISSSKVDMLWAQTGKIASGDDEVSRLNVVVNYLHDSDRIGSIESPKEYFSGCVKMRWGPYSDFLIDSDASLVYFGAVTGTTILGLGGSAHHVIGSKGTSFPHSQSAMPYMIAYLRKQLQLENESSFILPPQPGSATGESPDEVLQAVHLATTRMKGPEQTVEFVARLLKRGDSPYPHRDPQSDMKVLLGTPIYVALAE